MIPYHSVRRDGVEVNLGIESVIEGAHVNVVDIARDPATRVSLVGTYAVTSRDVTIKLH